VWSLIIDRMTTRNPTETRTRIMDSAESLVLDHGFAGTSVDAVIAGAGVTKGAFFHHFASKAELGYALVERYAGRDAEHLESTLARAERLSRDPLQQVLIFVGLLEEEMESLAEPFAGCLFASYCYQQRLFDEPTLQVVRAAMLRWRGRLAEKLAAAAATRSPAPGVDLESLADMLLTIFEGAFILSRTMAEPKLVARQLGHFRRYLELAFGVDARSVG
jgi:TetR/AcrR family transcriptional regulator, transcriptional repressor for nem operon